MFKAAFAAATLLIGGVVFYVNTSEAVDSSPLGQPLVVAKQTERNFGQITHGEELVVTFPVGNEGTRRLILTKQDECCGSDSSQIIVPPGKAHNVTVRIFTNHLQLGPGREVVCYGTNDPRHPTLAFTLLFDLTSAR